MRRYPWRQDLKREDRAVVGMRAPFVLRDRKTGRSDEEHVEAVAAERGHGRITRRHGNSAFQPAIGIEPQEATAAKDRADIKAVAVDNRSVRTSAGPAQLDDGEDPAAAARRELKEELGIDAAEWTDLGRVDPFTSMVLSPLRLFLARGLTIGRPDHEGTEVIRRVEMPLAEAVAAVTDGRITHAPSCVVILKADYLLRTGGA